MPTQRAPSMWPTICLKTWSSLIWGPNHTLPLAGHCSLPFLTCAFCCTPGICCSPSCLYNPRLFNLFWTRSTMLMHCRVLCGSSVCRHSWCYSSMTFGADLRSGRKCCMPQHLLLSSQGMPQLHAQFLPVMLKGCPSRHVTHHSCHLHSSSHGS